MSFLKKIFCANTGTNLCGDKLDKSKAYLDCRNLSIEQLSKPLFPVLTTKYEVNEKSPIANVCKKNNDWGFDIQDKEYKKELKRLIDKYPNIDRTYFYLSQTYYILKQHDEERDILYEGFNKADYKGLLAYNIGRSYLLQNKVQSIGWHMQACLLATPVEFAYKNLSMAALEMGMDSLYWRLQNAGDVIDTKHMPGHEEIMRNITKSAIQNKLQLSVAFKNFEKYMDSYLPGENDIPKDKYKRNIFTLTEKEYLIKANMTLLSRGDVTYCSW